MKNSKKVFTLIIVLALLLSCLSLSAIAASSDNVKQYNSILTFGSSITRGSGLPNFDDYYYEDAIHGLKGSYPDLVADACGVPIENRLCCTFQGETLGSVLALMGIIDENTDPFLINDRKTNFSDGFYLGMKQFFGPESDNPLVGDDNAIKGKELVLCEFGMTEIFYRGPVICGLVGGGTPVDMDTAEMVTTLIGYMWEGYENLKYQYPILIQNIRKESPDADIVIVGMFNPINGMRITEDSLLPLGDAASAVTIACNKLLKQLAVKYDCIYADVSNTGTPASEQGMALTSEVFMSDGNHNVHPTINNGLPYMARQIVSVLPEAVPTAKNPFDFSIRIDLGNIRNVTSVSVNGKLTKSYQTDGTVLTIHRLLPFAKSVTVTGYEDGSTVLASYVLQYDHGYTPLRIYGTNSVESTLRLLLKNVFGVIGQISDLFKSFIG